MRALNPFFRLSLLTTVLVPGLVALVGGCSSSSSKSGSDATNAAAGGAPNGTAAGVIATAAVSGTRLRVKSVTGGGAREVVAFHDMERNEDCTFQRAEGGKTRCYPAVAQANQSGTFTDAACKIPAYSVVAPTCADTVKYGLTTTYQSCSVSEPNELRKLADPATPTYALGPSGCAPTSTLPPSPGRPVTVPLGEVVPWTAFVEAAETVVPGAIVSEKILVATDGAKQHLSYRDDKLGADCNFMLMADGTTRCVPAAKEGPVYYGDSSCTKPLAVEDYSNNGGPCGGSSGPDDVVGNLWLDPSPSQCGGLRNVFRLGTYDGTASNQSIFQLENRSQGGSSPAGDQTTCTSTGELGNRGNNYRLITDTINTSLPSTPRVGTGTDRLVPAFVWPPGSETLVAGWHDTMNDVDCTFTLATDGKMRCLPTASTAAILFTDGTCTSPGRVAVLSDASCIGVRRYAREVSTTCPPTTRIFSLGADAHDFTTASILTTSGQCGKVPQAQAAFDANEVDPSQFVEGVAAVE